MLIGEKIKKPREDFEGRNRSSSLIIASKKEKKKFVSYQLVIYLSDFPIPEILNQFIG